MYNMSATCHLVSHTLAAVAGKPLIGSPSRLVEPISLHPQRPAIVDHQSPLKNDVDLEGESWIGLPYLHPIRGYFYQGSCLTEHVEQQHERHAASQLTWSGVVSAPVAPLLALPSQEAEAACCGGRAKSGATCGCGCGCLWWQSVPGTPTVHAQSFLSCAVLRPQRLDFNGRFDCDADATFSSKPHICR